MSRICCCRRTWRSTRWVVSGLRRCAHLRTGHPQLRRAGFTIRPAQHKNVALPLAARVRGRARPRGDEGSKDYQAFGGFLGWKMDPSPGRLFPTTRFVFRPEESPGMPRWRVIAAAVPIAPNDASVRNFFRLMPSLPALPVFSGDSLSATGPPPTTCYCLRADLGLQIAHRVRSGGIGPEDDTPATGRRVPFQPRKGGAEGQVAACGRG